MLRSHRFALVAAAAVFGLAGCGDSPNSTTSGNSLAVIQIGQGGSANPTSAGAETSADKMMVPYQIINFIYDGELPNLGDTGKAWKLPAGTELDTARVARIAEQLGVDGEVRELPADQGGGWMVGAADYTTANLNVSKDGMLSWWFNPDPSVYGNGTVECVVESVSSEGSEGGGDAPAPPDSAVEEPITTEPVTTEPVRCEEPAPPVNVPTQDEALAKATALFGDLGYDMADYEFEAYADEWSAYVTAYQMVGGFRSPLTLSAGFGAEGVLTWASGTLAEPQDVGDYPLVAVQDGIDRMNAEGGYWMGYYGPAGAMVKTAGDTPVANDTATAESGSAEVAPEPVPAETVPGETEPGGTPIDTVLVDPPVCDPAADCVDTSIAPEEVTVHLNSAEMALTMVWDVDGSVWLVPAYSFTSTDGGEYTVIAVDEEFVELPDMGVTPEPMPVDDTGTVEEVDADSAMSILVGVEETEATKLAEENGWTMRVVRRDGEDLAATMDYSPSRVNVAVEAGVVTEVISIG